MPGKNTLTTEKLSVPLSIHMAQKLSDKRVVRAVASSYDFLNEILQQIQRDIVTTDNRDTIGPTILGIKHIQDVFLAFKSRANDLDMKEKSETQTKP